MFTIQKTHHAQFPAVAGLLQIMQILILISRSGAEAFT